MVGNVHRIPGDIFEIAAASCHCGGDSIVTAPFEATEEETAPACRRGQAARS